MLHPNFINILFLIYYLQIPYVVSARQLETTCRILGPFAERPSLLNGNGAKPGFWHSSCIVGPAILLHLSGDAADLERNNSAHLGACARLPREESCIHRFFKSERINGGEQDNECIKIKANKKQTSAIILALMHRIPSELRS